ncbi:MAG TPA: peptidoglycan-associated lipoprotein Pal [Thermoanaerobaculia bacterium]|nr:peptidoglycan-associated lipoprotein Pal [Thermoanaerobaculia bacterium]
MSNRMKAFATSTALIAAILAMACPKKPKPVVIPTNTATVSSTDTRPPEVTIPPHDEQKAVQPTEDFVQPKVETEQLPANLEELNRVVQDRGDVQDAFFNYDEAALSADAQAALTNSANWLKKHGDYSLLVEGHCDERGTEQYNLALGDRRANTAKEFLATLGIDSARIRTVSYGEERPFDAGHDDSSWAKNRRAHLVIVR